MCRVKTGKKSRKFFTQERGVGQGCNLGPAISNISINGLAALLATLQTRRWNADYLQMTWFYCPLQQMAYSRVWVCHTWALTVNPTKTKIMIFQKQLQISGCSTTVHKHVEYCKHCVGLKKFYGRSMPSKQYRNRNTNLNLFQINRVCYWTTDRTRLYSMQ